MTNTVFLHSISRVKRLVIFRTLYRMLLIALFFFLCGYTVAIGIEKTAGLALREYVSFYVISFVISLTFSLLYVFITKKSFLELLIDIDARLKLKDRISTAYEYHTYGKRSEFKDLLIEDAGKKLSLLHTKQLFPPKFSVVHLLLTLLIVVNVALLFVDKFLPVSRQTIIDPEQAKKISTLLHNQLTQQPEDTKTAESETRERLRKKMEELTQKLNEQTMSRKELAKSLNEILQDVQGEQNRLTEELKSQLRDLEDRQIQELRKISTASSSNELRMVRRILNQRFGDQIPGAVDQNMRLLEEQQNLQELLEDIEDELESTPGDEGEPLPPDKENGDASDGSTSENGDEGSNDSLYRGNTPQFRPEGENMSDGDDQGEGSDNGMEPEDERTGKRSSPGKEAGKTEGFNGERSQDSLEQSKGRIFQDTIISAPKDDSKARIRSLTEIGKTTLAEEDITRQYQQELESILQKEDIPLNYREYIKNYFISIGLEPPRNEDVKE